jgi:putative transposase
VSEWWHGAKRAFAHPTVLRFTVGIVGWAKRRGWAFLPSLEACPPFPVILCIMPRYIRAKIKGSVFFFTVVLAERRSDLLVAEINRFRETYRMIQQRRSFETIAICILPDHIHAVWALPEGDGDFSTRWSLIKSGFSRGLDPRSQSASKVGKREKGIWQRRFWEHTIRDDSDLERHIDYIHFNPVKHGHVTRVADWPYSSFHRYVQRGLLAADWGGDMRDIQGSFGE